jgi:acetyl esterase/lipase
MHSVPKFPAKFVGFVRGRAEQMGSVTERIGVLRASAGGYLAACAATLFNDAADKTGAALDTVSARPDFLVLFSPVITPVEKCSHAGSRALDRASGGLPFN